jgi:hypothetical protein
MGRFLRTCAVLVCFMVLEGAVWASISKPKVIPNCTSPQQVAPAQILCSAPDPSYSSVPPSVAWNGLGYGALWVEYQASSGRYRPYFRLLYADGTPKASATPVQGNAMTDPSALPDLPAPCLLWNGDGYAAAWTAYDADALQNRIFFALLWPDGTLRSGPTQVSSVGLTGSNGAAPTLAFSGDTYAVVWHDDRYGFNNYNLLATFLDASGVITGAGSANHDIPVVSDTGNQMSPSAVWVSTMGYFAVAYQDDASGHIAIWIVAFTKTGIMLSNFAPSTPGPYASMSPSLATDGTGFAVAWTDTRDGNHEVYFSPGYAEGEVRVTATPAESASPYVVWTGGEYSLFWHDGSPTVNIWQARFSGDGILQDRAVQITHTTNARLPGAAFGKRGFLVAEALNYSNAAFPVGCGVLVAPPCPENALAYAITGTTATLAWLPVQDLNFDIAYYEVYRNNALVGRTDDCLYTDAGLVPGGTYNYSIRTVNATQLASTGCGSGSTVYVKANASLVMTVEKNTPHAVLNWTDDGTMNSYNVFRGTSPQAMQLLANTTAKTFEDPNALMDGNLYFYTVDDPVQ